MCINVSLTEGLRFNIVKNKEQIGEPKKEVKERPKGKIHVLMPGDSIDAAALGLPLGLRPQR